MKTKKCTGKNCLQLEKPISEFGKDKARTDGLKCWCKICVNEYQKEYRDKNKKKAKKYQKEHHKNFPWKWVLRDIKQRCENPNHKFYKNYGGRGIQALITLDEIKYLWFRDKAYLLDKPSIDREENDGHYS